jgi:hypothetical protein
MAEQTNTSQRVVDLSSEILGVPSDQLFFTGIEEAFPWLKFGEIIWARTCDFKAALFWVFTNTEPVHLNGDDALEAVANLLITHAGPLPDSVTPVELGEAVRKLTRTPRGYVGCQEFQRKHSPYIRSWLRRDTPAERDHFAKFCADPTLSLSEEDGTWSLGFFYFNPDGAVEKWELTGDAARIHAAKQNVAAKDKTFRWPLA